MENLAHTVRQLQSDALTRPGVFAELDRVLAAAPESPGRLLEVLSNAHARARSLRRNPSLRWRSRAGRAHLADGLQMRLMLSGAVAAIRQVREIIGPRRETPAGVPPPLLTVCH
jgi:hypothetical protein